MDRLIDALLNGPNFVFLVMGVCLLIALILHALTTIVTTASKERSRREIAAYIAEGSISPEQGERLIKADLGGGRKLG
jgi:hypothetical protein